MENVFLIIISTVFFAIVISKIISIIFEIDHKVQKLPKMVTGGWNPRPKKGSKRPKVATPHPPKVHDQININLSCKMEKYKKNDY